MQCWECSVGNALRSLGQLYVAVAVSFIFVFRIFTHKLEALKLHGQVDRKTVGCSRSGVQHCCVLEQQHIRRDHVSTTASSLANAPRCSAMLCGLRPGRKAAFGLGLLVLLVLLVLGTLAIWRERCNDGNTCNWQQPISTVLWPQLSTMFHYQALSYEEFLELQSGPGWADYFRTKEYAKGINASGSQLDVAKRNFRHRNSTNSGVHDESALRYMPLLLKLRNTSLEDRIGKYHQREYCVPGYYSYKSRSAEVLHQSSGEPGWRVCRKSFLTSVAEVAAGQERYLADWFLGAHEYSVSLSGVATT